MKPQFITIGILAILLFACMFCGNQKVSHDSNMPDRSNKSLVIHYSKSLYPFCLYDYLDMYEFLCLDDLQEIRIYDSSIVSLFQTEISRPPKNTIKLLRDTIIIEDIGSLINPENESYTGCEDCMEGITYVYNYWENSPSACYVVEMCVDNQRDTLVLPSGPTGKVQLNNSVFFDSTLFFIVTRLICDNDNEWAEHIPKILREYNIDESLVSKENF